MSLPEMVLGRGGTAILHALSDRHVITARNGTAAFTLHIFWLIIIIIIIIIITTTTTALSDSSPYASTDKTNKNKYT